MLSGTIGTLQITYSDPSSILVFDKFEENFTSGQVLSMPIADYGWAPRNVFVVNIGSQPSSFTATYQNAAKVAVSIAIVALTQFTLF